jgi:hypothetical protein
VGSRAGWHGERRDHEGRADAPRRSAAQYRAGLVGDCFAPSKLSTCRRANHAGGLRELAARCSIVDQCDYRLEI